MKKILVLAILAAAILAISVSSAFADTANVTGVAVLGKLTASDTVTVKATVNPKLVLQVVTTNASQTVDFGLVDPGTATAPKAVNLTVWSNKTYGITVATGGQAALMGLVTTLPLSQLGLAKSATNAGTAFTDNYTLNAPWNSDPVAYTATVVYTVVQN